jgi:hypothetical protein
MRKRLLLSLSFGAVGLAAAPVVGDIVGVSNIVALSVGGIGGAAVGCVISVFVDVFLAPTDTAGIEH